MPTLKLRNPFKKKKRKTRTLRPIKNLLSSDEKKRLQLYATLRKGEKDQLNKKLNKSINNSIERYLNGVESKAKKKSKKKSKRKSTRKSK